MFFVMLGPNISYKKKQDYDFLQIFSFHLKVTIFFFEETFCEIQKQN